jgi:hypothetical protein
MNEIGLDGSVITNLDHKGKLRIEKTSNIGMNEMYGDLMCGRESSGAEAEWHLCDNFENGGSQIQAGGETYTCTDRTWNIEDNAITDQPDSAVPDPGSSGISSIQGVSDVSSTKFRLDTSESNQDYIFTWDLESSWRRVELNVIIEDNGRLELGGNQNYVNITGEEAIFATNGEEKVTFLHEGRLDLNFDRTNNKIEAEFKGEQVTVSDFDDFDFTVRNKEEWNDIEAQIVNLNINKD